MAAIELGHAQHLAGVARADLLRIKNNHVIEGNGPHSQSDDESAEDAEPLVSSTMEGRILLDRVDRNPGWTCVREGDFDRCQSSESSMAAFTFLRIMHPNGTSVICDGADIVSLVS